MADQIGASDVTPDSLRWKESVAGFSIRCRFAEQLARNDAFVDRCLIVIDVIDEHVERADTLLETSFDAGPFCRFDDSWNNVEWKDLLSAAGVAINSEGNAHAVQSSLDRFLTFSQNTKRQIVHTVNE